MAGEEGGIGGAGARPGPWGWRASGCQISCSGGSGRWCWSSRITLVGTDDPVLPPSSTQCGDRVHLLYWRVQLQEVESEVRRLIRGYEGIPTEVPQCVLRSPTAYYEKGISTAGEVYRAYGARALNRMCHNQEEVVRRVCYHAFAKVQREENIC